MSSKRSLRIVELDASPPGLRALQRFHDESYVAQFPDPDERESLAQMQRYLQLKAGGWYGANNYHVLVALQGAVPVGGVVADYLARPNAGMIEFLFVLPQLRGQGLGRRLLDACLRRLRADARAQGRRLFAVVAEMNDPFRRPARPDNMDPFVRTAMWGGWGFRKLLCPYSQPALSSEQGAVDCLTLIVRPLQNPAQRSLAADWVGDVVEQYMRWAMRIDQPRRQREFVRLDAYLAQRQRIGMLPLQASIGDDGQRPFRTEPVSPAHRSFAAVVRLAQRAITVPGHCASEQVYRDAFAAARDGGLAYHLWRIALPGSRATQGMASFFSLPSVGFGGYVVLSGDLRGRGLLAPLLARIEARMMRDGVAPDCVSPGWMIECAADTAPIFQRRGFAALPLDYRPPVLEGDAGSAGPALQLLYKPLGAVYPPLSLSRSFVLRALREILGGVYGIAQPARHRCYRRALATLRCDADHAVALTHGEALVAS